MTDEHMKIIEVGGVKMEVDMRHVRQVNTFHVGDTVKVLIKSYSDSFKMRKGVIIDFAFFEKLPTIVVAYIEGDYDGELKTVHVNAQSKDTEIAHCTADELSIDKDAMLEKMDRALAKAENEAETVRTHRAIFLNRFGKFFEGYEATEGKTTN